MAENLFVKLNRIFRGGPIIKRRIANPTTPRHTPFGATVHDKFVRQSRELINYANFVNYQAVDRWSRYADFMEMEARGEIAAALWVYTDEVCSKNAHGEMLKVRSSNANIKAILDTLFHDTLDVDFYMPHWVRQLVKYGDFVLFHDIDPSYGIVNVVPIPLPNFQRVEGLNPASPMDVVYLIGEQNISNRGFSAQYAQVHNNMQAELGNLGFNNTSFGNMFNSWGTNTGEGMGFNDSQISHFRLLGNDMFTPYGTSVLDPARRLWRLLYMSEDLMLMYRAYRASERLAFYIDTRGLPKDQEENYLQRAINTLKREPALVPDKNGGHDYVFNPFTMSDDFFLPVNGPDSGTRIETVAGGTNTAQIEDVEYLHKQLFTALNVPSAYLGYGEGAENFLPQNLSQMHIRFSRTIERIQSVVLQQIYKMAYIQLIAAGFEGDDLEDFTIELASPSNAAQQSFLQGLSARASAASDILGIEGLAGRSWVRKHIMGWDEMECEEAVKSLIDDIKEDQRIAEATSSGEGGEDDEGPGGGPGGGMDDFFDDVFSGGTDREGSLLAEIIERGDDVDSLENGLEAGLFDNLFDEETRDEALRNSDNLSPYPRVDDAARWGSVSIRAQDVDGLNDGELDLLVKPKTGIPSPAQDAGWELFDGEDVARIAEEAINISEAPDDEDIMGQRIMPYAPPLKAGTQPSKLPVASHRRPSKQRPITPNKSGVSGMMSKRDRPGVDNTKILSPEELARKHFEENFPGEPRERKPGQPPWERASDRDPDIH